MPAESKWKDLLDEFRALGGVADNIESRKGAIGRGLFPIDRKKPIKICVPDSLLIDTRHIEFVDDKLRIKKDAQVSERERAFIEFKENAFSWGGGGKTDCEAYFESVESLPENVRIILVRDFSMVGLSRANNGPDKIQQRYLRTREIG